MGYFIVSTGAGFLPPTVVHWLDWCHIMIPVLRFASVFDISIRFVAAKGNGHLNPIVLAVILYHAWWMREIRCLVMTNAWMSAQQLVSWFSTWCWNTCIEIGFTPPIQINLYLPRLLPGRGGRSNIYVYEYMYTYIVQGWGSKFKRKNCTNRHVRSITVPCYYLQVPWGAKRTSTVRFSGATLLEMDEKTWVPQWRECQRWQNLFWWWFMTTWMTWI